MTDFVIRNGWILDGTGAAAIQADVSVKGGRIAEVGPGLRGGGEDLDAAGLTVAPGFIDIHTHSELALLGEPEMPFKVAQGVTTDVLGNCGFSAAPISGLSREPFRQMAGPVFGHEDLEWDWADLSGYDAENTRVIAEDFLNGLCFFPL